MKKIDTIILEALAENKEIKVNGDLIRDFFKDDSNMITWAHSIRDYTISCKYDLPTDTYKFTKSGQ